MDQFTVSSCEDVLNLRLKLIYTLKQPVKSFCNRQICISPEQRNVFNFVPCPTKCAYCTQFDMRSVIYVVIVPVALHGKKVSQFVLHSLFSFLCFKERCGGVCIFSFCTRQYPNNVGNSHVNSNSDH